MVHIIVMFVFPNISGIVQLKIRLNSIIQLIFKIMDVRETKYMDLFNKLHIFEPIKSHIYEPNISLISLLAQCSIMQNPNGIAVRWPAMPHTESLESHNSIG